MLRAQERAGIGAWPRRGRSATLAPMGDGAATRRMTASEYLAWEREQPDKHEYHLGELFAMAGGSHRHNFLTTAVGAELRAALRDRGCAAFSSDQRISAEQGERYVYADVVVACGGVKTEPGTKDCLANPCIVVEVLSRSTEGYDRGEKWEAYQRVPSLTDYLLVSQASARVEHFRREADGSWNYRTHGAGETVTLANGATLAVDEVYRGAFELAGD
jgi:Uma2 family endonuclease